MYQCIDTAGAFACYDYAEKVQKVGLGGNVKGGEIIWPSPLVGEGKGEGRFTYELLR